MEAQPIQTKGDYRAALAEVSRYFDADTEPEPGTPEFDRFDALVTSIQGYEAKAAPIGLPDPIGAIEFHLDRLGWTPADLEPIIGSRERVAATLEKRQPLTLPIIHWSSAKLGISIAVLTQPHPVCRVSHLSIEQSRRATKN